MSDAQSLIAATVSLDDEAVNEPHPVRSSSSSALQPASVTTTSAPSKAWRAAWRRLEVLAGRGAVALFGTAEPPALSRISTGASALDDALMGGLPVGRLAEIAGPPGIGKTSLALGLCSATQRRGGIAAVIDADGGLERTTLSRCGVDPKSLVIARPDSGEHALQIVDELLRAKAADLIVVDSVAALVPQAELALPTGTAPAGHLARLMSQSMRRLTLQAAKSRAVVVFVNQFRRSWKQDGIGYDVTTGGNALVYAAATRLFLDRGSGAVSATLHKARFGHEGRVVSLPFLGGRQAS